MHEVLEEVCDSLDTLASAVTNAWSDNRTLHEVYGWQHPALTRHDLAALAEGLANRIRKVAPIELDDDLLTRITDAPQKLKLLQPTTVPYMFNGNGHQSNKL